MTGVDDGVERKSFDERTDRGEEGVPVASFEVVAAHRTCEENIAGEELPVGVERDVPRRVPRYVEHLEVDARDGDRIPACDDVRRVVRGDGEATARRARPERLDLARRSPHLCAAAIGKGGHAADVIDVGVRDENPARGRAHPGKVEAEVRRIVARVDHRSLRRAALGAHDVAVALERPHHEAVDDKRHGERLSVSRRGNTSRMQRWDLLDLDAPDGARDPIVLHSDDGARAVLIVLSPGQSLGDHQVKENTWLTVLDGTVEITVDGKAWQADRGTMVRFAPDERHALRSENGARLLLLLAPWPGEGHYRGGGSATP